MNTHAGSLERRGGGIDPAALAAAALASAISAIAPPGPYGPSSMIIGLTILFLIVSYDVDPHRTWGQSLAFSAVVALVAILALGYPMEWAFAEDRPQRLHVLLKEIDPDTDHKYSSVPPIATIIVWMIITAFCYLRDKRSRSGLSN